MKNAEIIQQLNLEQKCALLSGETVFTTRGYKKAGIPSITLSDGPNGVRKQAGAADHLGLNPSVPATCFPTAATVACSWDPALGEQVALTHYFVKRFRAYSFGKRCCHKCSVLSNIH